MYENNEKRQKLFYEDEDSRIFDYEEEVSALREACQSKTVLQSAEKLESILRQKNIIRFYNLNSSLRELQNYYGFLAEKFVSCNGLRRFNLLKKGRRRLLIYKPIVVKSPELASAISHVKSLPKQVEVVWPIHTSDDHETLSSIKSLGIKIVPAPKKMVELIELITSLEPRLILYLTNQSAVFSEAMLLGCLRLAPFQIATTMSPVTTGLREIDFYLTGTENEQATPAGSYSEILIPIDGSINSYDGAFLPTRNSNLIDKRSTSITRYCVITGAVAKINKPFLLAVGAALCHHRDLEIWFGCYNPNWSSTIDREGFEKWVSNTLEAIGLDQTRVKFIGPFRDRSQVIEVIRRAELYLDTFPYTGAVSMVDVAAANVTPVIMSGDFPRFDQSRHSLAEMSTEFLLSKSRHEYVNNIVSFLSQKPSAGSIEKRPVGMPKDRPILSDRVWAGIGSFFS